MNTYRAALVVICSGLLSFGVVYTLLEVSRSAAAPNDLVVVGTPEPSPEPRPTDALLVEAGQRAVAVPSAGADALLRGVHPGDRLDILASLSSPADGRPITSVVVRGATVLRPPSGGDALVVEVPAADAIALAHLVLNGTQLGFTVWPANAAPPSPRPIDERTARVLLGLTPATTPTAVAAAPTPAPPAPVATPTPELETVVGAFIYQAQAGDSWESIAATFKLSPNELRQWNNAAPNAGLEPGALLVVPRKP